LKVMGRWSVKTVDVRADGTGLSSRAGTALLALVADRVGLTAGLRDALEGTRERRGGHEPGRVSCDLAVNSPPRYPALPDAIVQDQAPVRPLRQSRSHGAPVSCPSYYVASEAAVGVSTYRASTRPIPASP